MHETTFVHRRTGRYSIKLRNAPRKEGGNVEFSSMGKFVIHSFVRVGHRLIDVFCLRKENVGRNTVRDHVAYMLIRIVMMI